jgi:uncharacterized protein YkuJ
MKTLVQNDTVWSNEKEFLKIESNGKPVCKIISFIMENNKARFTKVQEINKTGLTDFLTEAKFKPTNKILTLV